jgi:hypothetical protein
MQELEITPGRLLRIYWLFVWRAVIGSLLMGAVAGFVIGLIMAAAGAAREQMTIMTSIAGAIVGLIWSIAALKMALEKRYKGFRIALIARDVA